MESNLIQALNKSSAKSISILNELSHRYALLEDDEIYYEGTIVKGNKYERNQEARRKYIEIHGCQYKICGRARKGLIHVHHIVPISSIKEEYQINYEKDIIPILLNFHEMIHKKNLAYISEEIISLLRK